MADFFCFVRLVVGQYIESKKMRELEYKYKQIGKQEMQIFLESGAEDGKIPEWGLMEFQGSFESREEGATIFNEYLGDLNYTKDGTPFFISGHHIMYGQEVKLQKPMAIIVKNFEDNYEKKYLVKAVIRRKIIFKSRPKPIISSSDLNAK